jgi:hypothetical protein
MAEKQPLIMVEMTKDGSDMTEDELDQLAKEMYDAMLANIERLEQSPPPEGLGRVHEPRIAAPLGAGLVDVGS